MKPLALAPDKHTKAPHGHSGEERTGCGSARRKSNVASRAVRDQIILDHLVLVKTIAVRVRNLPMHVVDLDDLTHAGILGLIDAASKYDAGKKVEFRSYAKHRIKGAILDSLRQLDWASRHLRGRRKKVESVTRDLSTKLDRFPTESEIAEKMGVGLDRWRQISVDLRMIGLVSASAANSGPDRPEFPAKAESQPDSLCAKEELREVLMKAMKTLPARHHTVVLQYYTNDKTMKEIAGILGVNESRVSQIHKLALERMATALRAAGIHSHHAF